MYTQDHYVSNNIRNCVSVYLTHTVDFHRYCWSRPSLRMMAISVSQVDWQRERMFTLFSLSIHVCHFLFLQLSNKSHIRVCVCTCVCDPKACGTSFLKRDNRSAGLWCPQCCRSWTLFESVTRVWRGSS